MSKCFRTLVDGEQYTKQLERLGDIRRIDEALSGLSCYIGSDAEAFPIVPGFNQLRRAKTHPLQIDGKPGPVLIVYFVIRSRDSVEMLWIGELPTPEAAACADSDDVDFSDFAGFLESPF
jgi:hypothetical protein